MIEPEAARPAFTARLGVTAMNVVPPLLIILAAIDLTKLGVPEAVANAEQAARQAGDSVDVDMLYITHAIVNEGPKLKRFMPAAQGRATPIHKRTSHIEIVVAARDER